MSAPEIYARQLCKEGFPLWEPNPGEDPAVELADVGYVSKGGFIRLFNASEGRNHPNFVAENPAQHAPLTVGRIQRRTPLQPGLIKSHGVSGRRVGGELSAGPGLVQAGAKFTLSCEVKEGATLILGDEAYRQDALTKHRFLRYIRTHHQSWLDFANNSDNDCGIEIDDLILVTGCDKTSAWACAVFSDESRGLEIGFRVGQEIASGSVMWGKWTESHIGRDNLGPRRLIPPILPSLQPAVDAREVSPSGNGPAPLTEVIEAATPTQSNQCVFLRGYRICNLKTFLRRKLRIATTVEDGFDYVFQNLFPGSNHGKTSESSGEGSKPVGGPGQHAGGDGRENPEASDSLPFSCPGEEVGLSMLDQLGDEEVDLLQSNYNRKPTVFNSLLYYILGNSGVDLAIIHDDDLKSFFEVYTNVDDFEGWLRKNPPQVHVDNGVGMLETTYRVFVAGEFEGPDLTGEVQRVGDFPFASGGHADIYLGEWKTRERRENREVGIRVLRSTSTQKNRERQRRFMREWQKFKHTNILSLNGICMDFSPIPAAISPWMPYGNVVKYLGDLEQQQSPCTLLERLNLLSGVASALTYLHGLTPQIVHCDVKGDKVLVSENFEAVLGGFGDSRTSEDADQEVDGQPGVSARWMAPELLAADNSPFPPRFSAMSDVYAFGCLIIQIISSQLPWSNIEANAEVLLEISREKKPPVPDGTDLPVEVKHVMELCWSKDMDDRPAMAVVNSTIFHCARRMDAGGIPPSYSKESSQAQPMAQSSSSPPSSPPPSFMQSLLQGKSSSDKVPERPPSFGSTSNQFAEGMEGSLELLDVASVGAEAFTTALQRVTALAPVLSIVRRIIEVCESMQSNRFEAEHLQKRCRYLVISLVGRSQSLGDAETRRVVTGSSQHLNHILAVMSKLSQLDRWDSLLKLNTISEDIQKCHTELDDCCRNFQVQSDVAANHWLEVFHAAEKNDIAARSATLAEIIVLDQDSLVKLSQDTTVIMKLFQNELGLTEQDSLQYHALERALCRLQDRLHELLPDIDLKAGEARRVGKFPVGGNAAFDIWEGIWLGRDKVALKTVRGVQSSPKIQNKFQREVTMWRKVWEKDRGRYILPFYGACFTDGPYPYMVSPWMNNGNVTQYLDSNPTADRRHIIKRIAEGLSLLHNLMPPIAHGDLKAANILINDNGQPLLADFGLSKILEDITGVPFTQSKGVSESYRWFAPELCSAPGVISTASDVFAYGMTVVEIMTGLLPFSHIKRTTEVLIEMQKGERPRKPTDTTIRARGLDDHLWVVLSQCWEKLPEDRLTIDEVLAQL